jgi:hypothetical protein
VQLSGGALIPEALVLIGSTAKQTNKHTTTKPLHIMFLQQIFMISFEVRVIQLFFLEKYYLSVHLFSNYRFSVFYVSFSGLKVLSYCH